MDTRVTQAINRLAYNRDDIELHALVAWLKSDAPIEPDERQWLADAILQRLTPRPRGRTRPIHGPISQQAAVADYLMRIANGEVDKNAVADVAGGLGVSDRTLRKWIADRKEIDAIKARFDCIETL
jgi:hypothetical protein